MTNRAKHSNEKIETSILDSSMTSSILSSLEQSTQHTPVKKPEIKKSTAKQGNKLEDYVNFLRALASPERLGILEALEKRMMCTSDIEQQFFMEQSTVDGFVDIEKGDNLYKKLGGLEVVIKDGIIQEIRGND